MRDDMFRPTPHLTGEITYVLFISFVNRLCSAICDWFSGFNVGHFVALSIKLFGITLGIDRIAKHSHVGNEFDFASYYSLTIYDH